MNECSFCAENFLPFRGMPSGFFFLAVADVCQTPFFLRPLRRFKIMGSPRICNPWGERRQELLCRFSRAVSTVAISLPNARTSALPISVLGVLCPAPLLPEFPPSMSCFREFREREDYISYAEHELRCFFPFRGMPSRYFVLYV